MAGTIEPLPAAPSERSALKTRVVVATGAALAILLLLHVPGLDGPAYHRWFYRRLNPWLVYLPMTLAATPFFLGQWVWQRFGRTWTAIGLLALANLALQIVAIVPQPLGLGRIPAIIENGVNTSYYSAAVVFVNQQEAAGVSMGELLSLYPDLLDYFPLHARYKPPGLVLFYVVLTKLLGANAVSQTCGAILIAVLAAACVPMTYLLIHRLGGDRQAAFCAASYLAMCPSLILFFPQFDQVYPTIVCAMILTWHLALTTGKTRWAFAYGGVLALATFMSYILLEPGAFLAAYTILYLGRHGLDGLARAVRCAILALLVVTGFYGLVWLGSGFDPIATYRQISLLQMADQVRLARPFPKHIVLDVVDVMLGTGWMSVPLIAALGAMTWRALSPDQRRLVLLAMLQFGVMAASALLPGESARLWLYLFPLLMAPIGYELARWHPSHRLAIFGMLLIVLMAMDQNLTFINMGDVDLPTRDMARISPSSEKP